jgi:hypothetical protein
VEALGNLQWAKLNKKIDVALSRLKIVFQG